MITYGPYLLTGLVFWNFIATVSSQGCQCFFLNESYIRQQPAPLAIYSLRTTLGAGFHFLLGLLVALVFVWATQGPANLPALVGLVPALAILFLFGWALATCAGVLNVLFQDSQHLIEVLLQVMFYATPIMYPVSLLKDRHMEWIMCVNPLASLLNLFREPILDGRTASLEYLMVGMAATLLTLVVGGLALSWSQRRIIFYL